MGFIPAHIEIGNEMQAALSVMKTHTVSEGKSEERNPLLANLNKREIPSLNGLRGAAALAVVVWHYLDPWKLSSLFPGFYAVTLFFELSGLLITWLLLKEIDANGHIDKRQFYSRRTLRLFPVFYFVWGLIRLSGAFPGEWAYFFYLGDYYTALTRKYGELTHAWSLGVEEKFYLIWPFALGRVHRGKLIRILIAVLILEPLYRYVLCWLGFRRYTWFAFDTHLDAIVLGCLIALLAYRGRRAPKWISHPVTPLCAVAAVLLFQHVSDLVTYLLAVILVSVICRPPLLLNNRVARYFGAISYSLYVSHPLAAGFVWPRLFGQMHHALWPVLLSQLAVAIGVASALHFAVEQPFLKLKRRLHPAKAR